MTKADKPPDLALRTVTSEVNKKKGQGNRSKRKCIKERVKDEEIKADKDAVFEVQKKAVFKKVIVFNTIDFSVYSNI